MLEIEVAGARLELLPHGAAYLPDQRCLLVADAHLGKAASFRRLPTEHIDLALQRLVA